MSARIVPVKTKKVSKPSIFLKMLPPLLVCIAFCLFSCRVPTDAPITTNPTSTTVVHATEAQNIAYICADVDQNWGTNWPTVLQALDGLIDQNKTCGPEPLLSKKYAAHFNYASELESSSQIELAVENYTLAFQIDPNRTEALNALVRLVALPEPTAVVCESDLPPLPDPSLMLPNQAVEFVTLKNDQLYWQGEAYIVKGVNYYPRLAPWHRFLIESDLAQIEEELGLIADAGFNTVRIFLWYEPLFQCQPEDAIPNEAMFQKVDEIIRIANLYDLKIILTLNDLPDLLFRPLYTDWARYDAQTTYIVRRYMHEPAILAWDLRNEGDLDYGARDANEARFTKDEVIDWLSHISRVVQENDPNHLVTAGWWGDPSVTEAHVDFLSFHHWYDAASLKAKIDEYIIKTEKPILLEEVGYHSWASGPVDQRDEDEQAVLLQQAVELSEAEGLLGWVIWTAFDFAPQNEQAENFEHHFGLWRIDLSPKPALGSIIPEKDQSK
ncbi:MAG: cellulase family glycosylhydrolase [Chloroflexota bacterium]